MAFYRKVKSLVGDRHALIEFCEKEDASVRGILAHIKFMDEHFPNWLDKNLSVDMSTLSQRVTRPIRALNKYQPELVPIVLEEVCKLKDPKTRDVLNIVRDIYREQVKDVKLPEGVYEVVVVDPPWEPPTGRLYDPEWGRGFPPYATMSVDQIKAMKMPIADDAAVFLWTIGRFLHESFHIFDAWELEYKATLIWVKHYIKIGEIFRHQHEYVQVGFKGKPDWRFTHQSTVFNAPVREHSRKPDEFYAIIDKMFPGPKIDMFAREKRKGWDAWGAEVDYYD